MGQSQTTDLETARRLRLIRTSKGISQRDMAKRAGVGSGTISQIESGSTQPSVALLKKILAGVDVNLGFFFSFELKNEDSFYFPRSGMRDLGSSGVSYLLVAGERRNRKLQMLIEEYDVGADSGRSALSHEGEECAVVIEGRLEVTVDGQSRVLSPGDAYYFTSMLPHRFRNVGDVPCKVISACTPSSF
ncbi:cupin domain-containing protein [Tropicibacter sp. R16_0]|uniref:cupin domain-containing protein n=1 Tax=Tropicibacter sp. R16_0 TaxID=2821102 RepID=UPI001ADCC441|nr:cupin domain-containing protein [Tropicibacter sp. R16_0]MBO9451974.1 cupin domain-containing protein [Tropicibacter sp. R16_0]